MYDLFRSIIAYVIIPPSGVPRVVKVPSVNKMSRYRNTVSILLMVTSLLSIFKFTTAELVTPSNTATNLTEEPKRVSIRKCCKENEILVEVHVGVRICKLRSEYIKGNKEMYDNYS